MAVANGHAFVVQQLVQAGADTETEGPHGQTALMIAAEKGYEEIVGLLERVGMEEETPHHKQ